MKVVDFFCGAGGFSEGFRQAGFDICFAVDKWLPAVNTYKANKPNAKVILDDVIRISNLPYEEFEEIVPDSEVIIGSPPCVAFSNSNKSGNADKTLGIQLLEAYLRIVARKKFKKDSKLKYWVLENVPNLKKYIKDEYTAFDLNIEGNFILRTNTIVSRVYNAKYFGAPTNRKRFLCGEFPEPIETHNDDNLITLGRILDSLGEPLCNDKKTITDFNYPELIMNVDEVTDCNYEYVLQEFEWKTAKRLKQDRGYMGRMAFPENLDKPARTVMATMSTSSREAMIFRRKRGGYRLPTVREAASLMSFPIDYKFYGNTMGVKYTLVGNAVPPKLSYAVAKAILHEAGENALSFYPKIKHCEEIEFINLNNITIPLKIEKHKRFNSKFKYHIPYFIKSAFRVELTNYSSDFANKNIIWKAEIHYSQGKKNAAVFTPEINVNLIKSDLLMKINAFIDGRINDLCSFNKFQDRFCMTENERHDLLGPFELLNEVRIFLDAVVPEEYDYDKVNIGGSGILMPASIIIGYYILKRFMKLMEEIV
ncbi:DNA cytosine methyltransferase [Sedimentibacter saalensis]|uniref:DNA cytosine methyltransferase n=1 Tax=Sedimentibacter saalensis TaxID=130788 RepID=UPI0028A119AB|nr:DNA cytosine methyltransferase [Sedimentibacter saalensis]